MNKTTKKVINWNRNDKKLIKCKATILSSKYRKVKLLIDASRIKEISNGSIFNREVPIMENENDPYLHLLAKCLYDETAIVIGRDTYRVISFAMSFSHGETFAKVNFKRI